MQPIKPAHALSPVYVFLSLPAAFCLLQESQAKVECEPAAWRCDNELECLSQHEVCNGVNDCSDLSDEMNCGKLIHSFVSGYFSNQTLTFVILYDKVIELLCYPQTITMNICFLKFSL